MKTNVSRRIFVLTFNMVGCTPNAVSDVWIGHAPCQEERAALARECLTLKSFRFVGLRRDGWPNGASDWI